MDESQENGLADIEKIKRWSPVWIVPIVTALIGAWILFYHFSHQGPEVTLITFSAEGIEAGKTHIKSRSVDVGTVETVTLSANLNKVIIKARLHADMDGLLRKDSVFWVVKPQIGREGITGLGTLLSGVFIELQPGSKGEEQSEYTLLDTPPLASPDALGIRVALESEQAGQLTPGDPVLFRGYSVGSVETATFDARERLMRYQLFIRAPFDALITSNVRFWKNSGIALDMSAQGIRVEMASVATLFGGGVSFDVPAGWEAGRQAPDRASYKLFDDQRSIQNSLYTEHIGYLLFFSDSVRGLQPGAPVEFRGIRMGTVAKVPFYSKALQQNISDDYRIPVLVHIEPGRLAAELGVDFNFQRTFGQSTQQGLRASLKPANLLTGSLFVDLDFYPDLPVWEDKQEVAGYPVLPTISGGLAQIQQKLLQSLDKFNNLPLELMAREMTKTLSESRKTLHESQKMLVSLNALMSDNAMQALPKELQNTVQQLNRSLQGFQPGAPLYNAVLSDMQRLDRALSELQPLLRTLNKKSNALVFGAADSADPHPTSAQKSAQK